MINDLLHKKYENSSDEEITNRLFFLNNKADFAKKELQKKSKEYQNILIEILEISDLLNERQN